MLGEGHYTVVLARAGHRTQEVNVNRTARHVQATTVHVASSIVVIGHVTTTVRGESIGRTSERRQ